MITNILAIILVLISAVVSSLGPIYLKKGAEDFNLNIKKQIKNKHLLFGAGLYFLASLFFIPALKMGELSVLFPIAATTYIWVGIFSMKFLNEKMNIIKWIGFGVLILGVAIIGAGI